MSSPSRSWSRRRAPVLLVLALAALPLLVVPPASADVPLPVDAVLTAGGRTTLVVDLSAARAGDRSVAVTDGTSPVPATLVPVLSPDVAITLVVDTSAAGAATLPAWSSAAARFSLEAPLTAQGVVITAARPAATLGGPQRGPVEIVRALTGLHPGGDRDTAAALGLAVRQFPAVPAGRRVVVLYTSAPDAGGPAAADLARTFTSAGTILVVAGTAGSGYWSAAAAATGGFFAPAADPVVVPALDQVQTTLAGRFLVQLDTPARPPARLTVRVTTADGVFTGTAAVPGAPGGAHAASRGHAVWWWAGGAAALLAIAVGAFLLIRRRRAVPPAADATVPAADATVLPASAGAVPPPSAAPTSAEVAAPALPADAMPDAPAGAPPEDADLASAAGATPTSRASATPTSTSRASATPTPREGSVPASTGGTYASAAAVARGRASVPGAIIRGRATVPPPQPRAEPRVEPRAEPRAEPQATADLPDPNGADHPDPGQAAPPARDPAG